MMEKSLLVPWVQAAIVELKGKGVTAYADGIPVGESNANAAIESAIRLVKERTRAIWLQALETHGVQPGIEHEMAAWAVRYSAQIRNISAVGSDGCTTFCSFDWEAYLYQGFGSLELQDYVCSR